MPEYAIQAEGVVKSFGDTRALNGLDLDAPYGSVLGVLGPNGAGKTTAVRILATLLAPDAGAARVCGLDVVRDAGRVRELIGLTGQYASVDEELTGRQNLTLIGQLLDMPRAAARTRAAELLERFDLADAAGRLAGTYSGGMRRRLDLAASLVSRPQVLFLDEPTTGLDPRSRAEVWDMVRGLVSDGTTVLLTTQYLEEADQLAGRIVVIDGGRAVMGGTAAELRAQVGGHTLEVWPERPEQMDVAERVLAALTGAVPVRHPDGGRIAVPADGTDAVQAAVARLAAEGVAVRELALRLPSLDEVFLAVTGHPAGELEEEGTSA